MRTPPPLPCISSAIVCRHNLAIIHATANYQQNSIDRIHSNYFINYSTFYCIIPSISTPHPPISVAQVTGRPSRSVPRSHGWLNPTNPFCVFPLPRKTPTTIQPTITTTTNAARAPLRSRCIAQRQRRRQRDDIPFPIVAPDKKWRIWKARRIATTPAIGGIGYVSVSQWKAFLFSSSARHLQTILILENGN